MQLPPPVETHNKSKTALISPAPSRVYFIFLLFISSEMHMTLSSPLLICSCFPLIPHIFSFMLISWLPSHLCHTIFFSYFSLRSAVFFLFIFVSYGITACSGDDNEVVHLELQTRVSLHDFETDILTDIKARESVSDVFLVLFYFPIHASTKSQNAQNK